MERHDEFRPEYAAAECIRETPTSAKKKLSSAAATAAAASSRRSARNTGRQTDARLGLLHRQPGHHSAMWSTPYCVLLPHASVCLTCRDLFT